MKVGKHQRLFFVFYEHVETHKKSSHHADIVYKMAARSKKCCMLTIFLLYFGDNFKEVLKFLDEKRFIPWVYQARIQDFLYPLQKKANMPHGPRGTREV